MPKKILHIQVPERFYDNFGNPFLEILSVVQQINCQPNFDSVQVDFSKSKFISPFYIGFLSSLLEKLRLESKIETNGMQSYLETIHINIKKYFFVVFMKLF